MDTYKVCDSEIEGFDGAFVLEPKPTFSELLMFDLIQPNWFFDPNYSFYPNSIMKTTLDPEFLRLEFTSTVSRIPQDSQHTFSSEQENDDDLYQ